MYIFQYKKNTNPFHCSFYNAQTRDDNIFLPAYIINTVMLYSLVPHVSVEVIVGSPNSVLVLATIRAPTALLY